MTREKYNALQRELAEKQEGSLAIQFRQSQIKKQGADQYKRKSAACARIFKRLVREHLGPEAYSKLVEQSDLEAEAEAENP
ncbi:hypothetical protein LCGC14_1832330 [marine sediment metagenome]|uniref:Uncharacterized protein n=1 Tax=marine sediment metagenome TaxID=412755 RepID=A0A0F9GFZ0_9ZZZZ